MIGVWLNKYAVRKMVSFTRMMRYDLKDPVDQRDWNKLFGIGFTDFWRLMFVRFLRDEHHKNSARFVWRYVDEEFHIGWYVYDRERRASDLMYKMKAGSYLLAIQINPKFYTFQVMNEHGRVLVEKSVPKTHEKKWGYPLGLYFGGNRRAPVDITVKMISK